MSGFSLDISLTELKWDICQHLNNTLKLSLQTFNIVNFSIIAAQTLCSILNNNKKWNGINTLHSVWEHIHTLEHAELVYYWTRNLLFVQYHSTFCHFDTLTFNEERENIRTVANCHEVDALKWPTNVWHKKKRLLMYWS